MTPRQRDTPQGELREGRDSRKVGVQSCGFPPGPWESRGLSSGDLCSHFGTGGGRGGFSLGPGCCSTHSPLKTIPAPCPHILLASSPALTWRDLQHLIIRASKPAHLQAEDWAENGVGRRGECGAQPLQHLPAAPGGTWRGSRAPLLGATCVPVSHYYGYGLLDAGLLVQAAATWTGTRPQQKCSVQAVQVPR